MSKIYEHLRVFMFKTFNLFHFTHIVSLRKQPYNPKVYPWLADSQVYKLVTKGEIMTWNTCSKPSPVAAQNSPRRCVQSQHISLLHSYSCRPPAVVPCTSRRLSRGGLIPGLPPEPQSLPAGWWVTTVNKEHLSSPQCSFPHMFV